MVSAVVLVNTELGAEGKVLESLRGIEGVEEAHALYSVYDLMARVKTSSIDELKETITFSIRRLAGVSTLLTLMIVD